MKKFIAVLLCFCICISLFSSISLTTYATETETTKYVFGKHSINPLETAGQQGFTPVMTNTRSYTDANGDINLDTLKVPPKQDALEEGATRWGLKGDGTAASIPEEWINAGEWNSTAIRSDGRITPFRVAAGVRFDVPADGAYNIVADFYNGSTAEKGFYHYIILKSGDTVKTLYKFDTATITATTTHDIAKGTRVQNIDYYLKSGDVIYFLIDTKGQKTESCYPNLEVTIKEKTDIIPADFVPTVSDVYKYGYTADNIFSAKGMQNFFPAFSGTYNKSDDFPIWNMIGSDKDPVSESDKWGSYTKWLNSTYTYAFVSSSGHMQPQNGGTVGVVWVVPEDGKYEIENKEIAFNIQSGYTVSNMYYSVYHGDVETKEATRLFLYDLNSTTNAYNATLELKKGDRLYFIMDSAGHSVNAAKPRIRLTITPEDKTLVPEDFTPTEATEYTFGDNARNNLSELGKQNFFPAFSKDTETPEELPVENLRGSNIDVVQEEGFNKWGREDYDYAGVRADGRIQANNCVAGVAWVAPKADTYTVYTDFKLNVQEGGSLPEKAMYYSVYSVTESATTLLYHSDTSKTGDVKVSTNLEVTLAANDKLIFVLDSSGQTLDDIYPNARVSITHKGTDYALDFKENREYATDYNSLQKCDKYSYGYYTENTLETLGQQNFWPVFGSSHSIYNYPIWSMSTSNTARATEDYLDDKGVTHHLSTWQHTERQYVLVRADGRMRSSAVNTVGVAWVAPQDGRYSYSTIINFYVDEGQTREKIHYGVFYGSINGTVGTSRLLYDVSVSQSDSGSFESDIYLNKGDRLYFIIDMGGESMNYVYPNAKITIEHMDAPEAPVVIDQTATTATLETTEGYVYGYALDGSTEITEVDSNVIENLQIGAKYNFYQRKKVTGAVYESDYSQALVYTMFRPGDVDHSTVIDVIDLNALRNYLLELPIEVVYYKGLMDANVSGSIDIRDLVEIRRLVEIDKLAANESQND